MPKHVEIRVWHLPQSENINGLRRRISELVAPFLEIEKAEVLIAFPSDLIKEKPVGIIIEVILSEEVLPRDKLPTENRRTKLARVIGEEVRKMFPNVETVCRISIFKEEDGFWSSKVEPLSHCIAFKEAGLY